MESIIHWFSRNHVAANFLMLLVVVLGVMTWPKLKKEIFPELSINAISIVIPYPNATPVEVEKGVIIPIEEAIQDIDGIDTMRSIAAQSIGVITVEVATGYNVRNIMDDVKTRVDAVQNIAEEAEKPTLEELIIKAQVLSIAVTADADEQTLHDLAEKVRAGLIAYRGGSIRVTQASLAGVRDFEISIEVSEQTLRNYGLTFDQVANAVRRSSLDLPGGSVRTEGGEVLIRTESRRYTADEFAPITVITRADGSTVSLEEIATIRDGFEEDPIQTYFNGKPSILINVFRVGNEDTLKIADTVKDYVANMAPTLVPEEVSLRVWRNDANYLSGRLDLLKRNGLLGLVFVAIVLALFLRPSLALLVALGIPVSFAGAIALMPYTGISINMISLFAFILVLGIVVDDAIVVGENVYRRMRNGEDPKEAAPKGTHEVGVVVIFGIITTAMAFTPMLGLSGVSGKIWPNIPLIVIPTLIFSLFQSKLILPAHLALLKRVDPDEKPGPIMRIQHLFSRGLEAFVDKVYRKQLKLALNHRYIVLAAFIAMLIVVGAFVKTGWIQFNFFPNVETDVIISRLQLSKGVSFKQTQNAVKQIESKAFILNEEFKDNDGNPVIVNMLASVGSQPFQLGMVGAEASSKGSNLGEVVIELQPGANRDFKAEKVVSRWRELVGEIPGTVELTFRAESAAGGNAIDIELVGNNIKQLEEATLVAKAALGEFDGVIDIGDSDIVGKRELKLAIKPSAEALGLRLSDVANQVRQGFYGDEIQRLQRGKDEVKVFVRYPRNERRSISDLENMKIRTASGSEVPFSQVATATFGRSNSTIQRTDQQRAIRITADVDKGKGINANEVVKSLLKGGTSPTYFQQWSINIRNWIRKISGADPIPKVEPGALVAIEKDFPGIQYAFQGEQKDQARSVEEMGAKFIIAIMGMYILMAIPLRSYIQPLIVMSVIPFGLVGAVIGHVITGYGLSIMSMCGVIALSGVVVNDSLVLVDYVNRHVAQGQSVIEAAWEAGARRFRPILLTSLTTFAGLTPMLLETDVQAKFLIPMAVSLSFGILFATGITLVLVPCIYLMLEDVKNLFRKKKVS